MKLDDFNNIDFKNAGSLPAPVKLVLLGFLFVSRPYRLMGGSSDETGLFLGLKKRTRRTDSIGDD